MRWEKLVLATHNLGKAGEIGSALEGCASEICSLRDSGPVPLEPEAGSSYLENAMSKARQAATFLGVPAIGDDSGLEVDALSGAPGVRSKRILPNIRTDEERIAELLRLLDGVPPEQRTARFRCILAFCAPNGEEYWTEGVCSGTIRTAPAGSGGFGYDPVFQPDGMSVTFAQLPIEEKNRISHRGRAARAMREWLCGGEK